VARWLISLSLLLTAFGPRATTYVPQTTIWIKSPDSDVDRFCIADHSKCVGLIDSTGREIVRFDPPLWTGHDFFDGLMVATPHGSNRSGYIDKDGRWAIEPRFFLARDFQNGYAVVRETSDGPWRFIDRKGRSFGPLAWYGISDLRHGLAPVRPTEDELQGYIDRSGAWAIPRKFESAHPFSPDDRLAAVREPDGLWGYIDTSGEYRIEPKYLRTTEFRHGRAAVVEGPPCWFQLELKPWRMGSRIVSLDAGGRAVPTQGEERPECSMKLIDPLGRTVKDRVQNFKDFTAIGVSAKIGGKWGIVGRDGEWITPAVWDKVGPFSEGLAQVYENRRGWGYVDKTGAVVIPPAFAGALGFSDGLAPVVAHDRKRIYINRAGAQAFPRNFKGHGPFRRGIAHVLTGFRTWEYIDTDGRTVYRYSLPLPPDP